MLKKHEEKIPRCMNNSIILWENYINMHKIATPNTYIHVRSVSWFDIVTSIKKCRDQTISLARTYPLNALMHSCKYFCTCE